MRGTGLTRLPDGLSAGMASMKEARKRTSPTRDRPPRARLAATALDHLPMAVAVLDRRLALRYWNLHAAALFGIPPLMEAEQPLLADALRIAGQLTPRQIERVVAFCDDIIAGSDAQDAWLRLSLGRQARVALKLVALGGNRWLLGIEDLLPAEQTIPDGGDAMLDALTGLNNRRHFNQVLRDMPAEAPPGDKPAVLLIDLDGFGAVNETLGHSAGNSLLCLAARRLRREIREDDLIARLGGDEFAILQPDGERAESLAARLVAVLSQPFLVEGQVVTIGASIGIVRRDDGASPDDLMRQAELALYHAKSAGRRTWRIFDPSTADQARSRRALETDLRQALALGGLSLVYQPRRDVLAKRLTGFEARPRWTHPVRGSVPPSVFVQVAEDIGCTEQLMGWILMAACEQAVRHLGVLPVAVNVLPGQLATLHGAVNRALIASGLEPNRLEIAITEAAVMTTDPAALQRLAALGVRIALDDFGSDNASLRQVMAFPFDRIRISRSLTAELGKDRQAAAIIWAIATLGAGLNMTTIACGVETAEQAAQLAASGCAMIQGRLAGPPVAAADTGDLIAQDQHDGRS